MGTKLRKCAACGVQYRKGKRAMLASDVGADARTVIVCASCARGGVLVVATRYQPPACIECGKPGACVCLVCVGAKVAETAALTRSAIDAAARSAVGHVRDLPHTCPRCSVSHRGEYDHCEDCRRAIAKGVSP